MERCRNTHLKKTPAHQSPLPQPPLKKRLSPILARFVAGCLRIFLLVPLPVKLRLCLRPGPKTREHKEDRCRDKEAVRAMPTRDRIAALEHTLTSVLMDLRLSIWPIKEDSAWLRSLDRGGESGNKRPTSDCLLLFLKRIPKVRGPYSRRGLSLGFLGGNGGRCNALSHPVRITAPR